MVIVSHNTLNHPINPTTFTCNLSCNSKNIITFYAQHVPTIAKLATASETHPAYVMQVREGVGIDVMQREGSGGGRGRAM